MIDKSECRRIADLVNYFVTLLLFGRVYNRHYAFWNFDGK